MLKTLEKYQKCSYSALEASRPINETQSSYQEYLRLKAKVEVLQRAQRNLLGEELGSLNTKELEQLEHQLETSLNQIRNLLGEELGSLNTKELEQLEHQLETSLNQIRSTKTQYMLDQLVDLQNREHMLVEANRSLRKKLDENNNAQVPLRQAWEAGGQSIQYSHLPPQSEGFFQPLGGNSTLQIGYNPIASEEMNVGAPAHNVHGFIPGWML
ncbi:mads-box protein ej2 [Quercus suber]|uniref:Mads-box protein ej2 n=1 Tax=Quercus suber TaxID=58331 RepID=A0AAW0KH33_QUESU